MASNVKTIKAIYEATSAALTAPDEWYSFLRAVGQHFKYPYHDQLLIYAQRPDATACATVEKWNKHPQLRRWINRGAQGIAQLRETRGVTRLEYLFDISDTNSRIKPPPTLWELREEHYPLVAEALANTFGSDGESFISIEYHIIDAVQAIVDDNAQDYLAELLTAAEGSVLADIDENDLRDLFNPLLLHSAIVAVMHRCKLDAGAFISEDDFEAITAFHTPQTLAVLGSAASDLSEMALRTIERTIRAYDREREHEPMNERSERSDEDEHADGLPAGGRLPDSQSSDGEPAEHDAGQIRPNAPQLPDEPQAWDIQPPAAIGNVSEASDGYRPGGSGDDGTGNGEPASLEPLATNRRYDGTDSPPQSDSAAGRGSGSASPNLQLSLFPSTQEQQTFIEAEAQAPASSIYKARIEPQPAEKKTPVNAAERRNYLALQRFAPQIITGEYNYVRYQSDGFMPLTVEAIGHNRFAMMHFFEQNGDLMRDPDMELTIDKETQSVRALTFQQDGLGLYQSVEELEGARAARLQRELNSFLSDWLGNIEQQGYLPELAHRYNAELDIDEEIRFENITDRNRDEADNAFHSHVEAVTSIDDGKPAEDQIEPVLGVAPQPFTDTKSDAVNSSVSAGSSEPSDDASVTPRAANYRITDESHIGEGTPRERIVNNIRAIRLMKRLESEHRAPTQDEQHTLARYVGWGGLPQVFDVNNHTTMYEGAREALTELLAEEEYKAARASTVNAHYTSPQVISAMYQALANMGFESGDILEPSCGTGNFFGMLPEFMEDSKLYGVELDGVTGRIARLLYPEARIEINGFEDTAFRDNSFDVVVGNVPFGDYKVFDRAYNHLNYQIHDYFIAKSLDMVRSGGVVALITSKGTLDKRSPDVRRYIAHRAELLGAIRLPNTAFKGNAGTEVTTDILFLQKRDAPIDIDPDWCFLGATDDGVPLNNYYIENPHMMLGTMVWSKNMYGNERDTALEPFPEADLSAQLQEAIRHIDGQIEVAELNDDLDEPFSPGDSTRDVLPADPSVRNYSFTLVNGVIYYRVDGEMHRAALNKTAENRVKGLIALRDVARKLIDLQLYDAPDAEISLTQRKLNDLYDRYTSEYGLLNSRGNSMAFSDDGSYPLLCSLEILDENGQLERKSDIFSKRTIRQHVPVTSTETSAEALAVSLAERGRVDIRHMISLCGKDIDALTSELSSMIFKNPLSDADDLYAGWETADEYLSGNVREKLVIAQNAAASRPDMFSVNAEALNSAQPQNLEADEIAVRLGTVWIPDTDIQDFMCEILSVNRHSSVDVSYFSETSMWNISGKSSVVNIEIQEKYGTSRINGLHLLEECLNLRDARIFDVQYEADGKKKYVFNRRETILAQQKQELLRTAFKDWIFSDRDRRERLVGFYNTHFNNKRARVFDGSHLVFPGMNPEYRLDPHQSNGVARILYGGNSLLAHVVGSGKTFTMITAAMELKRMGLANKSLIVVPSHLTEQWAAEFYRLYPAANILTATKKDFEKANRRKFCARIATGDYDAVIIGHSQFERIPISRQRQIRQLEDQIEEIVSGISLLKAKKGENFAVKQMEGMRKRLEVKLKALTDDEKKDDVVTFEQLGVDRLFVDESHEFKNLFTFTKMRNVAGVTTSEAQKATDMYMKCRYMDEITEGKGIVFASGTPISNTLSELYTVQRYLQYDALRESGLTTFDAWASVFAETATALELAPEGTGYRTKTRFARFHNLPELMMMYRQAADIQTAEMLNLPKPALRNGKYTDVVLQPSEIQRELVASLAKRAERVRSRSVDASEDNMLAITNDGRKLALDQRLLDPSAPDDPHSKVNACVENVMRIWEEGLDDKTAQLIFCDMSTPGGKSNVPIKQTAEGVCEVDWGCYSFNNVYDDLRAKLIDRGVPPDEIAFIHEANSDAQKADLFARVRSGEVRVLIGSTAKCGAGTNVQKRLKALHHLDVPWRPSDLAQRDGRILRQGNDNSEVEIFRYVTQGTFDAYSYQLLENKQRFISQVQTGQLVSRSAEDIDTAALSYAEVKALAAGDPRIKEKMDLDVQVDKLKLLKASYNSQRYRYEVVVSEYPQTEKRIIERIDKMTVDVEAYATSIAAKQDDTFQMTVNGVAYDKRTDAGEAMLALLKAHLRNGSEAGTRIGNIHGFELLTSAKTDLYDSYITLRGAGEYTLALSNDPVGSITRIENGLRSLSELLDEQKQKHAASRHDWEQAQLELEKPFAHEQELTEKLARLAELNIVLSMNDRDSEDVGDAEPEISSDAEKEPTRVALAR